MNRSDAPKISVIIPVYNVAPYLRQCLTSVIRQTFTDTEIILCLGKSTDESDDICREYAARDNRIKIIHQTGKGLVNARKEAIRESCGQFVCFVDGDDYLMPNGLSDMYAAANGHELLLNSYYYDCRGKTIRKTANLKTGIYNREYIAHEIIPRLFADNTVEDWQVTPYVWDKLFAREKLLLAEEQVSDSISLGEDLACVAVYLASCTDVAVIDKPCCHYRYRMDSSANGKTTANLPLGIREMDKLANEILSHFLAGDELARYCNHARISFLRNMLLPRMYDVWDDLITDTHIFPFGDVKPNSRLVIYGAGTMGMSLRRGIDASRKHKTVAQIDRDAAFYVRQGIDVMPPKELTAIDFDFVLVAIVNVAAQKAVMKSLADMGIDGQKILAVKSDDESVLRTLERRVWED